MMTVLAFKKHIEAIHPYEPGKPIKEVQRELGLNHVIKLASNENPLGVSPLAMKEMKRVLKDCFLYPEGGCHEALHALSNELKLPPEQIIFGNGSNEIIELVGRGFLSEGDEVISSESSFLVYPILTQASGGKYISVPMTADYRYDLKALAEAVTPKTKIIFIANPNNPTGTYVRRREVERFLKRVPARVVICFDEAYFDFVDAKDFPDILNLVREGNENILLFRTFSKAYGLAGLRIGYACASKKMISYLHKIRQPFNVNMVAQAAALGAIRDKSFRKKTREVTFLGKQFLSQTFKKLGLEQLPSQANFILVNVNRNGREVCAALLKKGIIVRAMDAYGFDSWIRVTVGLPKQNRLFIKRLTKILGLRS